jgi:2-hydroxy-3-keto-5-methylthiopentenyl-1-phosphate phosphatase
MDSKRPVIALMYDFDNTLCTTDMQNYSFIPGLGMEPDAFWDMSHRMAEEKKMDKILAYMYLMVKKAGEKQKSIRRDDLVALGKDVQLFPGVTEWFDRINAYGEGRGAVIQHYIISSGLKEIIEGSVIAKHFKEIYACSFHYNDSGVADWPAVTVNYTTKTQFLFRINKGVLLMSEDVELNKFIPEDDRPVPFRNMIYFGDGMTDVPCMKLTKTNGGKSIAVYTQKEKVENLLLSQRVDFIAHADYTEGSELDGLVKAIIAHMACGDFLARKSRSQINLMEKSGKMDGSSWEK